MKTSHFFIATAVTEFVTGFALIAFPSLTSELLLGLPLTEASGITVARVAGAALLSLAVACWLARNDEHSHASKGIITAMFLYNAIALAVLAYAGFDSQFTVMLILALITHFGLMSWCIIVLKKFQPK